MNMESLMQWSEGEMYAEKSKVGFTDFQEIPIKVVTTENAEVIGLAFQCITCGNLVIDRQKHELYYHR